MAPLAWTDPWFRKVFPPLVAVQLTLLAIWFFGASGSPPAAPAQAESATATPPPPAVVAPAVQPRRIRETAGFVGKVRLGMTIEQARRALGEPLVEVQAPSPGSRRFEVLARAAGLRLAGKHRTIDRIVVTSVGSGPTYRTTKGLKIGDRSPLVGRAYTWAYRVCGREWWVKRGKYTLRITAERRITAIALTSRRAPTFVDCT